MAKTVRHIFTFHDHLFKIVSISAGDEPGRQYVEDEYGTVRQLPIHHDLEHVRKCCEDIMRGYREEMSMPGAKS